MRLCKNIVVVELLISLFSQGGVHGLYSEAISSEQRNTSKSTSDCFLPGYLLKRMET